MSLLLTSLALSQLAMAGFPDDDQLSVGPYGFGVAPEPISLTGLDFAPTGLELRYRRVGASSDDELFDDVRLGSALGLLRLGLDDAGAVQLDQLRLETGPFALKMRRNLGDRLDLAFLGGDWENTFEEQSTEALWYRGYTPSNLTLLGFSDTDGDDDEKLKYYISIGTGVGGELLVRLAGPAALYAQAEGAARTMNRHRADVPNQVRHEVSADAAIGLCAQGDSVGAVLSGWGELVSQWETRDGDGKSGVDRQQMAWGVRLTLRGGPVWTIPGADPGGAAPKEPADGGDKL